MPLFINSYNLHGWNNGVQMVYKLKYKTDIIMLQELQLYPSTIERLNNNNNTPDVLAISCVKDDYRVR